MVAMCRSDDPMSRPAMMTCGRMWVLGVDNRRLLAMIRRFQRSFA